MSKEVVFPFDVAKVYQMFELCKCLGRKMKNIFVALFFSCLFFSVECGLGAVCQWFVWFVRWRDFLRKKGFKGLKAQWGRMVFYSSVLQQAAIQLLLS